MPQTTDPHAADDRPLSRMLRPRSVAILGVSAKPGTAGQAVLRNLRANDFAGPIHLVGRSGGEIDGLKVLTDIDALPPGIDVAVLTLPASSVGETVLGCVRRQVATAIVFAAGFAELGEAERGEQERIGAVARAGGLSVVGPNCLGYTNHVDGFAVGFANVAKVPVLAPGTTNAVAVVAQSGGLGNHVARGLAARGVPVAYSISTGNEMDLGLGDFIRAFAADAVTRVIVLYAEHIRKPADFLAAVAAARAAGKPVVMMHPGRSQRAKAAARSHTGALAGDYEVMRACVLRAGVLLVDTLDELLDVAEILCRYPAPGKGGLGIATFSGAFCGIALDFAESAGVEIPPLSPQTEAHLAPRLPAYIPPKNPLDLGTQPIWQPELVGLGVNALLADPAIGAVVISIPAGGPANALAYLAQIVAARDASEKPLMLAMLGDSAPLPDEFLARARQAGLVLSRSSDRSLRAMAAVIGWANRAGIADVAPASPYPMLPTLRPGSQPEWLGKQLLAAIGIATPPGGLAKNVDEAIGIAERIGFPVVLKAQAGALEHKTEAGGVMLNIATGAALRDAWETLHANIARAAPGLVLDGVLVEIMAPRGLELVVGARRDPHWGPMILVGLGGILVEALGDVRLLAPDATEAEILSELDKLKTARLLHGFRHLPPIDTSAVADAVMRIGRLMLTMPQIGEIDINPLVAHAKGAGVMALDALVVVP